MDHAAWKSVPFHWLARLMATFKEQNPSRQVALLGYSKGAWWGALFLAHAPSLFKAVVLIAPYASPMASPEDRAPEGHGVAAAAASGSQIAAVCSEADECCAWDVEQQEGMPVSGDRKPPS